MRRFHPPATSAFTSVLISAAFALAACDGGPMSAPESVTETSGDGVAVSAMNAGEELAIAATASPFDIAEVFFEFNTTDDDLGFQVFLDAEDWQRVRVSGPSGRDLVEITARHALAELGITELRFESAEPSPAEVLDLFGPGVYSFSGRTIEGDRLESMAILSHQFAPAPDFAPSDGEIVDASATVVTWNAPGAERVEVIIENEALGHVFDVIVDASTASLDVPSQFLMPGTEYKIEILAIAANGNRTIAESTFVTMN